MIATKDGSFEVPIFTYDRDYGTDRRSSPNYEYHSGRNLTSGSTFSFFIGLTEMLGGLLNLSDFVCGGLVGLWRCHVWFLEICRKFGFVSMAVCDATAFTIPSWISGWSW